MQEAIFTTQQDFDSVNVYFYDECRFGLFTRNGRMLTARGVKPVCPFQQVFKSTYLLGAYAALDGDSCMLEMPFCNALTFQLFLNELAQQKPEELKIMVLDNAAFHKAKSLVIPQNIKFIFLPPYSPELNPAEKIWAILKRKFTNKIHGSLEEISQFIDREIKKLTKEMIKSVCAYQYIFQNIDWTK